ARVRERRRDVRADAVTEAVVVVRAEEPARRAGRGSRRISVASTRRVPHRLAELGRHPRKEVMKRIAILSTLFLTACPETGVVCRTGTQRCGNGCADFTNDSRNCGTCGQACFGTQVCVSSTCQCRSSTTLCDGQCVVLDSDPLNCGGCGHKCT